MVLTKKQDKKMKIAIVGAGVFGINFTDGSQIFTLF
jgi:predicted NAD/FAD-binding protein